MNSREQYLEHYVRTETHMQKFNPVEMTRFFGENVARLRSEHGFTQEELAKMTGVSKSTIVRIELGTVQHIDMITALKLSSFFRVPLMKLVDVNHDLMDLYSQLIQAPVRTRRLIKCILDADAQARNLAADYDPDDRISLICFSEPVYDGISSIRFFYDVDNISQFRNHIWYPDACCIFQLNSNAYHPLYHCGDRLVVSDRYPRHGEIGVFLKNGHLYIRKYKEDNGDCYLEKICRSDDHAPDVIEIRNHSEDMSDFSIFGTIIYVI